MDMSKTPSSGGSSQDSLQEKHCPFGGSSHTPSVATVWDEQNLRRIPLGRNQSFPAPDLFASARVNADAVRVEYRDLDIFL